MSGSIFDIQRFSIHDGPGIRTTVFFKGCPLRCLWCHNPESQEREPEIFFSPEKCITCRYCEQACPHGSHVFVDGLHLFQRDHCEACGACTAECFTGALEVVGKEWSAEEIIAEVEKDVPFYQKSGGGMTLSGGEPMMQFELTHDLLRAAHERSIHTCIETSGCAPIARYREILPLVDLFLFDIKETDPARHREYTGVDNRLILDNLRALNGAGAQIILRCPVIPGLNDRPDHFRAVAELASTLEHVLEVDVLPYHPLGESKNLRLGKQSPLGSVAMPEKAQSQAWVEEIQGQCKVFVK
jgi:pyruvate formate lyase activating enzyme